jgi:hypothetical protein
MLAAATGSAEILRKTELMVPVPEAASSSSIIALAVAVGNGFTRSCSSLCSGKSDPAHTAR